MQIKAASADEYIRLLPEDRQEVMNRFRSVINENLPPGFEESISYGMITWVVPHSTYPAGYHCDPKQALPFLSLASQKNFIALYHMGIYADEKLLNWFTTRWSEVSSKKLDMGKSCIRFKKPADIPFELMAELVGKMSPQDWIARYEAAFKR